MKFPFRTRAAPSAAKLISATLRQAFAAAGLARASHPLRRMAENLPRARAEDRGGRADKAAPPAAQPPGTFHTHQHIGPAGSRAYKLYVPAAPPRGARPLLVMLHGCTQSADDFAAGTQMNRLAEAHGLLVVYPEQTAQANPSKCWNWFKPQDQQRGAGEPALMAGIVAQVAQAHGVDPQRVFVAGLSAGAAMAVVLGATYPETFAAVGAHSGLPYGSAHDIPSALSAMKGGRSHLPGLQAASGGPASPPHPAHPGHQAHAPMPVPVIVFHGDRDHTVQARNGAQIVQQALAAQPGLQARTETGATPAGRRYTRTVHSTPAGQAHVESWVLHGAGHAWAGGHASGSFTDAQGPDASAAMLRFFMAHPQPQPHPQPNSASA